MVLYSNLYHHQYHLSVYVDKDEIEGDSHDLLLEYWVQLSALLSGEFKALMPSWDRFVSVYGKVIGHSFALKIHDSCNFYKTKAEIIYSDRLKNGP